jgi:tetratricopeptide (TPR) repeat protein
MKIKLYGKEEQHQAEFDFLGEEQPKVKLSATLSANRSTADTLEPEIADGDLLEFTFDDDTCWYGAAGELPQLFGELKRSDSGVLEIPSALSIPTGERGIKQVLLKGFKIFEPKTLTVPLAQQVAARIESNILQEGVMLIDEKLNLKPLDISERQPLNLNKPILLLIHGTCSSTEGSFGQLVGSEHWGQITTFYGSNMLSSEHFTWSKSPLQNALEILEQLPAGAQLHLLSHSRGGLIGEILSRCSSPETFFSDDEIAFLGHQERKNDAALLGKLNAIAQEKQIRVKRFVRVAAPVAGTSILSRRLDHFLNFLLNVVGFSTGIGANPIFRGIKALLASTVAQRGNPEVLPGLEAMMPDSPLQPIFNNHLLRLPDELRVIAGNSGMEGIGQTLVYLMTRLYYFTDNDFVVDTDSMFMGGRRAQRPCYQFMSGGAVNHFSYFGNDSSQLAIKNGLIEDTHLPKGYQEVREGERNRALLHGGSVFPEIASGKKPVVVLLPGIMGSNLHDESGPVWINYRRMAGGSLTRLKVDAPGIEAKSVVGTAYAKLVEELGRDYDVIVHPFDWRLSLQEAGQSLAGKLEKLLDLGTPVQIVAHSMGGLVVRDLMMHQQTVWERLSAQDQFRVILLGTPWQGSYLIPEVITGHSSRVRQIAMLALFQSKLNLLEVFVHFPGLYELLPIDEESHEFEDHKLWSLMSLGTGLGSWVVPDEKKELAAFKAYKQKVKQQMKQLDLSKFIYVAGKADATVSNFTFRDQNGFEVDLKDLEKLQQELNPNSPFGQRHFELIYKGTDQGDGSVTWRTGIPKQLPEEAIYYSSTTHMELANDDSLFPALRELLTNGKTERLPHRPTTSRSAERTFEMPVPRTLSNDPEVLMRGALGMNAPAYLMAKSQKSEQRLRIRVKNGDLRYARYPVIVGHFNGDGIVSAEKAMDYLLNNRLSEREALGLYPGRIGSNLVVFSDDDASRGAVIVGLGLPEDLTPFTLSQTVEMGCLEYLFKMREAGESTVGVSTLLVGSGYGFLSLNSSLQGLVEGVRNANRKVQQMGGSLPHINEIEIIELHRHKALNAFYLLHDGIESRKISGNIQLIEPIEAVEGRRTFAPLSIEKEWWKRITAAVDKDGSLQFSASTGRARVEQRSLHANQALIKGLLNRGSLEDHWDRELAKTVFELLLPHDFKAAFQSQQNILLILDEHTAWYPWELLHYNDRDGLPICVSAGMIRQLTTSNDRQTLKPITNRRALVIGDPLLEKNTLPQLPEAEREARMVGELLGTAQYETSLHIRTEYQEVMRQLYKDFRIIHIASHGVLRYGPGGKTGILLSEDVVLSPAEFNQISGTPELVFINSCYMGKVEPEEEQYFQDKYELAANIGTQLIRNGVKAVVVAGWAVNDAAARLFAETFYMEMLNGTYFGDAVKAARASCYRQFPNTTTWGAYQCYGDQYFVLENNYRGNSGESAYVLDQEILIDLEKVINRARAGEKRQHNHLEYLKDISRRIDESGLRNGKISEWEAKAYAELGAFDEAIDCYNRLQTSKDSDFTVKAIEQWCNLRVRVLVRDWEGQFKTPQALKAEAEDVIAHLESLLRMGETEERLNLLGSAYKRLCFVEEDTKQLKQHLATMGDYYRRACLLENNDLAKLRIYPFSNWITAEKLLKDRGRLIQLGKTLPSKLEDYLQELLEQLEENRGHKTFWDFIAIINIYQCQLLDADTNAERHQLKEAITTAYRAAWRVGGSDRQKNSEVVHTKFVLVVLERLGQKDGDLYRQVKLLEEFFKTL